MWNENDDIHIYEMNEIDISQEIENSYEIDMEIERLNYELDCLKEIQERNAKTSLQNFVDDMIKYHKDMIYLDDLDFLFDDNDEVDELFNSMENLRLIELLNTIKKHSSMICPNCYQKTHHITSYKNGKIRCSNCMSNLKLRKSVKETRKAIKFLSNKN